MLTEQFLAQNASVVAVEKDELLARSLTRLDPEGTSLCVLPMDIMDCSLEDLVARGKGKPVVLVSNLPYHLTAPILQKIFEAKGLIPKIVLMVQEEAARRLTGPKSGQLGICLSFFYRLRYLFRVPKSCFWPKPKVDSAVIALDRIEGAAAQDLLFDMIQMAFAQRRKTVLHSLQQRFPKEVILAALEQCHLPREARPDDLHIGQWALLCSLISARPILEL